KERISESITIYSTPRDKALGTSMFLFANPRLGRLTYDDFKPRTANILRKMDNVSIIQVTNVENIREDNSHGYFRASPWVSSDIVMGVRFGLPPEKRGLFRNEDDPIYHFPEDYPARVQRIADDLMHEVLEQRASESEAAANN
ncbi:MAG: alpha/beta hydrolase, partial [Rhodospirillales bacterium]|nr:alpha/beta hydrolase [Rhodospirillales bacterium]